ncbi:MAG: polyprenyl synthetase family protein, partial [Patescibacteria group bacterium]|nr:polyprenyl synthetase family protein [Patescibacteria group bacterium]
MEKHLQNLKKEIDQLLKEFLEKKQREAKKLSPVYGDLVNQVTRIILGGGKRLRPILVYYGYKSIKNPIKELTREQLLSFSICAELFHSACLVHDDIMDSATIRHGQPTVNSFFTRQYGQKTAEGLAILAGDLILVWADEILTKFKKQFVLPIQTLEIYDKLREEVYFGQTLDLIQT